jgi:succinyl-diaminopimelate desuccinylase
VTRASTAGVLDTDAADLLGLTTALVAVRSESHHEAELADLVEARLRRRAPSLAVDRVEHNVVVRTQLGRDRRVLLGGHLDTVPANAGNEVPRVEGDVLHGLGAADMKSGLAVLLRLAEELHASFLDDGASRVPHDVTLVFYEAEEVRDEFNGLGKVFAVQPELLAADFAVLLEPTDGWVEAGCQGVLVAKAGFDGERAHAARPWMGSNAIHTASDVLARLAAHETDVVDVDGLAFRESFQVVGIEGGVQGKHNVVPDRCTVTVNRRFAPKYTPAEAEAQVRELLEGADDIEILQAQMAAPPNLTDPLVDEFVSRLSLPVRPKLGWTDVARFAAMGVPAVNFGPGDPEIAHTQGELVTRASVEQCHDALGRFVGVVA